MFEAEPLVVQQLPRLVASSNPVLRATHLGKVESPVWRFSPAVVAIAVTKEQKEKVESNRPKSRGKKKPAGKQNSDLEDESNEGYTRRVYFVSPSGNRLWKNMRGLGSTLPVVGQRTPNADGPKTNAVTLNQFGGGGLGGGLGGGGMNQPAFAQYNDPVVPTDDLAEILEELVAPKSWESPEAYIRVLPGRLIIRQNVKNHRAIIDFLDDLGVYRGLSPHSSTKTPQARRLGYGWGGGVQSINGGPQGGSSGQQGGFFAVPNESDESTK